jgi:hypothetical protein
VTKDLRLKAQPDDWTLMSNVLVTMYDSADSKDGGRPPTVMLQAQLQLQKPHIYIHMHICMFLLTGCRLPSALSALHYNITTACECRLCRF